MALRRVTVLVPFPTFCFLPFFVARDRGFFKEEGLDLNVDVTKNDTRYVTDVLDGKAEFTSFFYPFIEFRRQSEMRLLCGFMDGVIHRLIAKPEIKSVAGLRGKTVMVNIFKGTSHMETIFLLRKAGLDPNKDLKLVEAGPELEVAQIEALKRGEVDAIASSPPFFTIAERLGFHELGFAGDTVKWTSVALTATAKLVEKDPGLVKKAVTATKKAVDYCSNNKEGAVQAIIDYVEYGREYKDMMGDVWENLRWTWTTRLPAESVKNFLDVYCRETGMPLVDPEPYIDRRFLNTS